MTTSIGVFLAGSAAGILGGFLGIGGGVVMMPVLRFMVGLSPAMAAGTCVMAVTCTTLGGTLKHYQLGHTDFRSIFPIIAGGIASACVFSSIFPFLAKPGNAGWLDMGTGAIFSVISVRMIVEGFLSKDLAENGQIGVPGPVWAKITLGFAAGILPGLFGIGTGALLVPAFVLIQGAPMKTAIGSSLACFFTLAFLSAIFKISQGFADIQIGIPLCLGTILGSSIGASLTKRFQGATLKVIFGVLFLYVSLKYILRFFEVNSVIIGLT